MVIFSFTINWKEKSTPPPIFPLGEALSDTKLTIPPYKVGKKLNIDLPITNAIYSVLYQGANPEEAVKALMTRNKKNEMEEVVNNGFVHN